MNLFSGLFLGAFFYTTVINCVLMAIFGSSVLVGGVAISSMTCFIASLMMECIIFDDVGDHDGGWLRKNNYPKPSDCPEQECPKYRPACKLGICNVAVGMCGDF